MYLQHFFQAGLQPDKGDDRKEQEPVVLQVSELVGSALIGGVWSKIEWELLFQSLKNDDEPYRHSQD